MTSSFQIVDEHEDHEVVPLGKPIPNAKLYVAEPSLELAVTGISGEIFIAGSGLARSYFGAPGLTAESFLPNPFATGAGQRMFRTGDHARNRAGGSVHFAGRRDLQVKVRGFRIEIEEVGSAAARTFRRWHSSVRGARNRVG